MNNLDSKSGSFLLGKGFAEEQQIHFTVFKGNSRMIRVPNWPFSKANLFIKNFIFDTYVHDIIINYTALPGSSVCAKDKVSAKKVRSKDKVLDLYLKNSLLLTTTTRRVLNHRLTLTAANLYILTSKNKNTLQFPTETYYYYINFCLVSS